MNTLTSSRSDILARSRYHALAAFLLVLAGLPTKADVPFTTTGWLIARPLPGITVTNTSGQVYVKGNAHVVRFQANDVRVSGRLEAWMDLAYQSDGSAIFSGPAYLEVGTWDSTGTNFIPSGMVWALNYSGVIRTDGSTHYSLAGYGIGGNIEGLRVSGTATRANAEPTTPYLGSGTIQPAPVNTTVVVDDFNDGILKKDWVPWSSGTPYLTEANGQLKVRGVWNRPLNDVVFDHSGAYWPDNWSVPDGQTVEWRAEVVGMNQDAGGVGMGVGTANTRYYALGLASNSIFLYRRTASNTLLFSDAVTVRQTNIVLCLALTRHQSQAVVTIRVEDRDVPDAVLYQRNYLDMTPFLSGNSVGLVVAAKPELQTSDASASFDNFCRQAYEVPRLGIERTVRLSWPNTGMNFVVEAGPTVNGPWLPVQDWMPPGCQQLTVPQSGPMQFFRVQQAP